MIEQVTPAQFTSRVTQLVQAGSRPVLLDVREPWELNTARIAPQGVQFVHIPMQQIPGSLNALDMDQPLFVLCHHGVRSMHVANYLQAQGFDQLFNVQGGIDAWSSQVDHQVPVY